MIVDWTKLDAKPGDLVLPAWDAMKRAVRAARLIQGRGVRLAFTANGTVISAEDGVDSFSHPFMATLAGDAMTFTKGLVSNMEPVINGVPISGNAVSGAAQPGLTLAAAEVDASTLQSWACVEVSPKMDGTLDPATPPVMAHRAAPTSTDPAVGRQPIALLVWANGAAAAPTNVYQVSYFNMKYVRTNPTAGQGVARHFFL